MKGTCDASISFDGGKTWHEVDGSDFRIDALAEGLHTNRQLQVYASGELFGTFNLKPEKPRKQRQTPPFWSVYK